MQASGAATSCLSSVVEAVRATLSLRLWLGPLLGLTQPSCLVQEPPRDVYADAAPYETVVDGSVSADAATGSNRDGGSADLADAGNELDASPFNPDATLTPPPPECDFRGRWLVTERLVASGIGIRQAVLAIARRRWLFRWALAIASARLSRSAWAAASRCARPPPRRSSWPMLPVCKTSRSPCATR